MYNNNPILDSPHLGEKQKIYHERGEVERWQGGGDLLAHGISSA
jgi:hypothetical protein